MPIHQIRQSYRDTEAFVEAARGWNLDFRQLEGGGLSTEHQLVSSEVAQIGRVRQDRKFHQMGAPPATHRTFGLLELNGPELDWCGRQVRPSTLLAFEPGGDFKSVSRAGFEVYTISMSEQHLAELSEDLGLQRAFDILGRRDSTVAAKWCGLGRRTTFQAGCSRWSPPVGSKTSDRPAVCGTGRLSALAYIEATADEPHTMRDLCRAVGTSERTLQYAFQERFALSPKAYLRAIRLNAVRRALNAADLHSTKISDVANLLGYWHMGQFAADYRRFFGELPSATLERRTGQRLAA